MAVALLLVALVAAVGVHKSAADTEHIDLDSFSVGECVAVDYTVPSTGRVSINLYDAGGDIVLVVDYRVDWGSVLDTVVFNTRTAGAWGAEQTAPGVKSTPGTVAEFKICATELYFDVSMNQWEVLPYVYRTTTEVTRVEYDNYSFDSTLKQMCAVYSA